jgi:hypothetical protein
MKNLTVVIILCVALFGGLLLSCENPIMDNMEPEELGMADAEGRGIPVVAAIALTGAGYYSYNCAMPPDIDGFLANCEGIYFAPGITKLIPASGTIGSITCSKLQDWVQYVVNSKVDKICENYADNHDTIDVNYDGTWVEVPCYSYYSTVNCFSIHCPKYDSYMMKIRSACRPTHKKLLWDES